MWKLISSLARFARLRQFVQFIHLHKLGNGWLRSKPLVRTLPESGIVYRATRLESIPLAREMLEDDDLYDSELLPPHFTTFADLGCNVGYFTCWLAHLAQGRTLRGLMLDANPQAVKEARWHTEVNRLREVFTIHGIAGEGKEGEVAEFYLYESNISSASQMPDAQRLNLKGQWEKICVPCVRVENSWRRLFDGTRCNVLKVDIEGSEMGFLKAEKSFLQIVDSIFVEWHTWRVSLAELRDYLVSCGFRYVKTIDERDLMGTAFFLRNG